MLIKGILDEDFVNYKLPSMFISTAFCDFKCEKENGVRCCQNSALAKQKNMEIDTDTLIHRYLNNPITKAIVFGGLEPMMQYEDLIKFLDVLRGEYHCYDPVVIYTGYNRDEIAYQTEVLFSYGNVVMKFGRFIPGQDPHYDAVLGVKLASYNQYGADH